MSKKKHAYTLNYNIIKTYTKLHKIIMMDQIYFSLTKLVLDSSFTFYKKI